MSVNDQIRLYLQGNSSYNEGCSLFYSITHNKPLAIRLMTNYSESNEKTLTYELDKYLSQQPGYWDEVIEELFILDKTSEVSEPTTELIHQQTPIIPEPVILPEPTAHVFNNIHPSVSDSTTTENKSIREKILAERQLKYRLRGHLHGGLRVAPNPTKRKEIALELLSCQKAIDSYNLELEKLENGEIPMRFVQDNMSAADLQKINNLKEYIRRTNRKLSICESKSERMALETKLEKYKTELSKYGQR